MKQPAVYIVTNRPQGTLYTGVTASLAKRIYEHKSGAVKGFSSKYNCNRLVYYELHATMLQAITREKQIKGWLRNKKITLIESMNPQWKDLYDVIV